MFPAMTPNRDYQTDMPAQFLKQSWQRAWSGFQVQPQAGLFERLVACYSEPHRRYHTLEHLGECLEKLQFVRGAAEHPDELELALWFHDAVYELKRQDNEEMSALWASREVMACGASLKVAQRVQALVLVTRHAALPASPDQCLLVDIDLSILGAATERFDRYERQVREEFDAVPEALFQRKRLALLGGFLQRSSIFSTMHFRAKLEEQARANLRRSMARLADSSG